MRDSSFDWKCNIHNSGTDLTDKYEADKAILLRQCFIFHFKIIPCKPKI